MNRDTLKKTFVLIVLVAFLNVLLFSPSYTQNTPKYDIDFSGAGGGSAPTPTPNQTPPSYSCKEDYINSEGGCISEERNCRTSDGIIDPDGNGKCRTLWLTDGVTPTCECFSDCTDNGNPIGGTDPRCSGRCQKPEMTLGSCGPKPGDEENCGCN